MDQPLGCRYRYVTVIASGNFERLEIAKGLDCRDGKFISAHPFISSARWIAGLDFALVGKEWPI